MTADADTLYNAYRVHHPRKGLTASPDDRKSLARILCEAGSVERAVLYIAWVHESDDHYARQLRGKAPIDGTCTVHLALSSLERKVDARCMAADAWEARGRTAAPTAEDVEAAARAEREAREDAEAEAQARADNERRIKHYRDNGLPMPAYLRVMQ